MRIDHIPKNKIPTDSADIKKTQEDIIHSAKSSKSTLSGGLENSGQTGAQEVQIPQIEPVWDLDTVEITDEAKEKANDLKSKRENFLNEQRSLLEELRRVGEMSEGLAEGWKIKIKCLQIAMRIMSGNEVPKEDHRFLMENDAELYSRAISMKIQKTDPEEYDRLSEDDKDKDNTTQQADSPKDTQMADQVAENSVEQVIDQAG
ncbi:MAG: hypothetical protein FWH17_02150 [Oscillospiraceae bacterium]|nr:hypothetical protein [Oscillospiraceae bacterium]